MNSKLKYFLVIVISIGNLSSLPKTTQAQPIRFISNRAAIGSLSSLPKTTQAQPIRFISNRAARGLGTELETIYLYSGGINVSFVQTGEKIQKVWIDDPGKVGVDYNVSLDYGAEIIHLRRIKDIDFNLLVTEGSSTLLTVITTGSNGTKKYMFKIDYANGDKNYSIEVEPEISNATNPETEFSLKQRSDILGGLKIARSQGWISVSEGNEELVGRVYKYVELRGQNWSKFDAAMQAGVSVELVEQLQQLGQTQTENILLE